jgi:hypothetical protein
VAEWLRRAGHLPLEDGRAVTWTVAEGRRGRRWREAVTKPGQPGIRHSLLLETDPDGWFAHLELSTEAGLLTLHPEGDGTLHGNVVTRGGIRHVRGLGWDPHGVVFVDGSVVSRLAGFAGLGALLEIGGSLDALVLRITRDLELLVGRETIERPADRQWAVGDLERIAVDADGLLPARGGTTWPLEDDPAS